jgi:alpha-beta hydrolase superfamily lysophospholipase
VAKLLATLIPRVRLHSPVKTHHLSRDPSVGEEYISDPLVFTKATIQFGDLYLKAMAAARASISAIDRPTLVVHGTDDEIVPPSASASLAASPHVERKMFPGIRHELHNEPESPEILAYITRWIESRLDEFN